MLFEELGRALYPGPYFATVGSRCRSSRPTSRRSSPAGSGSTRWRRSRSTGRSRRRARSRRSPPRRSASRRRRSSSRVEHAKTREQFGKPIGIYQAVSHPIVDTYVETELARSLAYWAAWCVAEGDADATVAALAAKAYGVRDRRRRVRALDPGARRHRLHVGAPAAPLLQAGAVDRGLRRLSGEAARRDRRPAARLDLA